MSRFLYLSALEKQKLMKLPENASILTMMVEYLFNQPGTR